MKLLQENNNHIVKNKADKYQKYRCICSRCGSVFVFDCTDVRVPSMLPILPNNCAIMCPNKKCRHVMALNDKCIKKFKDSNEEVNFCHRYDE